VASQKFKPVTIFPETDALLNHSATTLHNIIFVDHTLPWQLVKVIQLSTFSHMDNAPRNTHASRAIVLDSMILLSATCISCDCLFWAAGNYDVIPPQSQKPSRTGHWPSYGKYIIFLRHFGHENKLCWPLWHRLWIQVFVSSPLDISLKG